VVLLLVSLKRPSDCRAPSFSQILGRERARAQRESSVYVANFGINLIISKALTPGLPTRFNHDQQKLCIKTHNHYILTCPWPLQQQRRYVGTAQSPISIDTAQVIPSQHWIERRQHSQSKGNVHPMSVAYAGFSQMN
jgi:hypothetical protein